MGVGGCGGWDAPSPPAVAGVGVWESWRGVGRGTTRAHDAHHARTHAQRTMNSSAGAADHQRNAWEAGGPIINATPGRRGSDHQRNAWQAGAGDHQRKACESGRITSGGGRVIPWGIALEGGRVIPLPPTIYIYICIYICIYEKCLLISYLSLRYFCRFLSVYSLSGVRGHIGPKIQK